MRKLVGGLAIAALLGFSVTSYAQNISNLGADAKSNAYSNGMQEVYQYGFNGATWDRMRAGVAIDAVAATGFYPIQNYVFNGTNWDRERGVGSSSVVGTGVPRVQIEEGYSSSLNLTAATTVKATSGRVFKVSVVVAGAAGQVCDVNGACAAANVVATIPAVVGVYDVNWPMLTAIRIEPGAGQTVAVSWQ